MRTLRKLILGETWFLPLAVAVVLLLAGVLSVALEATWRELGGPALLAGVLVVLALSVRRG